MLHLADLHLGWEPSLPEIQEARRIERDARLSRAVDLAIARGVDAVIIAGDLFETHRPKPALVQRVRQELTRLVESGILPVTVPGNHDEISYHDSVYREHAAAWPGVLVTNPTFDLAASLEVRGERLHLYSLAYTGGVTPTERPLAGFQRTAAAGYHIAVLHGSVEFHGGDRSLPIDKEALIAAGFDYVALGHIHRYQLFGPSERPLVYAGMIDGKGFDDPGTGMYTLVTLSGGGCEIERIDAQARPVATLRVDAGAFASASDLLAHLRSAIDPEAISRVVVTGSPAYPFTPEELRSALAGEAHFLQVDDESEGFAPEFLQSIAGERTIRGSFAQRMLRLMEEKPAERTLIARALALGLEALKRGGTP